MARAIAKVKAVAVPSADPAVRVAPAAAEPVPAAEVVVTEAHPLQVHGLRGKTDTRPTRSPVAQAAPRSMRAASTTTTRTPTRGRVQTLRVEVDTDDRMLLDVSKLKALDPVELSAFLPRRGLRLPMR
jgi:hypothetical protein